MENEHDIHNRMLSNISDDYSKVTGEFIYGTTKAGAIEFDKMQKKTANISEKNDVEKLTDDELTRFIYQRTGIIRKISTKSTTTVIISGSVGASIQTGDFVGTDTINFLSLEDKVIGESGLMHLRVECEQFGIVGNVPANSINKFPISIPGLINVYNPDAVANGYEEESNNAVRQRYYDKLQRPGKAGNKYHYEEWAKSVVGIGDARVFPRYNGPLTMKVVVIDANKQPASNELVQAAKDHIEEEMPFGVEDLRVLSATAVPLNLKVTLTLIPGYTEEIAKENIKRNIIEELKKTAFRTSFVSYAKIN